MAVYSPAKKKLKPGASSAGTMGQRDRCVGLYQNAGGGDRGHQKWKQNLLKYVFCNWLSFVSMDCCCCGRGALSAGLMLLCAGARGKNKWFVFICGPLSRCFPGGSVGGL